MSIKPAGSSIIALFAANPVAANLLMLLVIALGLMQVGSIRKEAFPSMEPNMLTISISYNSGSAEQSEEALAIKVEEKLEGLSGVKSVTSSSTGNGATITVEKQSGYDLNTLLSDVKSRVDAISRFPAEAEKPVIEKAERKEHSIWLQLYGDSDRYTLQKLATELKADLLAKDSIARVNISGWRDPMISVEINEARLQSYNLSLSDIETAINNSSSSPITATLRNKHTYIQLKASEQSYLKEDFAAIPIITSNDGRQILLGDIATIHDTWDDSSSVLSRFNGDNSLAIQILTIGNSDITRSVTAAHEVAEIWLKSGNLPQGVRLVSWYDRSKSITQRLALLVNNATTGILFVFILLAVFLNLTVAFWVAMGLPFIFLGTLYFMGDNYMGLSLNEFTTFGFIMALGIVVDDAVVVGESIYTERSKHGDTLANTIKGTMRVAIPTLFGVFTTVAAFYALSNIEGGLGQLYSQFAAIVAICLVLSVIESKLILPAHLAHLNTHRKPSRNWLIGGWTLIQNGADKLFIWFNNYFYRHVIEQALHFRYAIAILFIALFILVISMPFTGMVRTSFFPEVPGETVRAELTMQKDTSFGQTHASLLHIEASAYQADEELRSGTDAKSGITSLQLISEADQSGKLTIEFSKDAPYAPNDFTRRWQKITGSPEGVQTLSMQSSRRMVSAFRVELRATDDDTLIMAGKEFKQQLMNIPAVSGIEDNLEPGQPQLNLKLSKQGQAMGFTTEMLSKQILQAFNGQVVQRFQRSSDEIEVKVRYPEKDRQNPADVLNASVRTSQDNVVPLSSVAILSNGYTRDTITRIDGKRAIYISSEVDKELLSSTELVTQLKRNIIPNLQSKYPGLDIHFAGEAEQQAETQASMMEMFLLALLVIYMLLAIPLKSYIQPLLIMSAIPFGVVGAILGHWYYDLSLGILSLNGIIALSGVVVNDSLLLVARFNDVKNEITDIHEAISTSARNRLRAVLLTSFTTFAGLMPLLSETSHQAQFLIPAAVSLAYGIMFATIVTLILIPVLLMIQLDVHNLLLRIKHFLIGPVTKSQSI